MQNSIPLIKTCANCKYFKILKEGYEVKDIVDTAYVISRCKKKGWKIKEYYLANPKAEIKNHYEVCEYWEEWSPTISIWSKMRALIGSLFRR